MLKIARRGASGYAPENTTEAFINSTKLDCDVVEFDLHMTRDGHIVVMHDHTVQRTTDGIGRIDNLMLHEIKSFNELNGESIPTLQGVIDILKNKKKMMLDIKDQAAELRILEIIEDNNIEDNVIIDSDDPDIILNIKSINPRLHVYLGGANATNYESVIKQAEIIGAEMIKTHNLIATKELIRMAHQHHVGVYVWGAEKNAEIRDMILIGVDAIVCNFPDRISAILTDIGSLN